MKPTRRRLLAALFLAALAVDGLAGWAAALAPACGGSGDSTTADPAAASCHAERPPTPGCPHCGGAMEHAAACCAPNSETRAPSAPRVCPGACGARDRRGSALPDSLHDRYLPRPEETFTVRLPRLPAESASSFWASFIPSPPSPPPWRRA